MEVLTNYYRSTWILIIALFFATCATDSNHLTPSVTLISKNVNGVVINKNNKKLVVYGNPGENPVEADLVLMTHCRRDLTIAARKTKDLGAKTYAPVKEVAYFSNADTFWKDFTNLRFADYRQQSSKYPIEPLQIDFPIDGGDTLLWEGVKFEVIDSPGYTRGAVSYICEIDNKKIIFSGDLIYGMGKIFDLYSLQDEIPELNVRGYHGFAGRISELIESLQAIKSHKPDILVPSRGPVILNPDRAIDLLINRLQRLYSNYLSTSAYKWYTDLWYTGGVETQSSLAQRVKLDYDSIRKMPQAPLKEQLPDWLKRDDNSVLINSISGASFLIDCGTKKPFQNLWENKGNMTHSKIDGIFITHYHNDHTEYIPQIVDKYNCPVYVTQELEDILKYPDAYRLPAMTRKPINNISVVPDGYQMDWNEFSFTFYNFPGQTLYHNALLVETEYEKILFVGDSFTPSGMDDYCIQNRNFIEENNGFLYCIDLLRKIPEDVWLVNQHVSPLFKFNNQQLDFMEVKIRERAEILTELSPWEDPNLIIDERWARIYPYGFDLESNQTKDFSVIVKNHLHEEVLYGIRPHISNSEFSISPEYMEVTLGPKQEGEVIFSLTAPQISAPAISLITADIIYRDKTLLQWCEGIVTVRQAN